MGREEAVTPTPAELEFIGERSRAISAHFMNFAMTHALDMDTDTWPDELRAEFDRQAAALIEEWKRKAHDRFPLPD